MIADAIIWLGILAAFLLILAVGGLIADYVFPLIPPLDRWINRLADNMERQAGAKLRPVFFAGMVSRAGKVSVIRIEKSRTRTDKSWRDI